MATYVFETMSPNPHRSYSVAGSMAVCSRCLGIYMVFTVVLLAPLYYYVFTVRKNVDYTVILMIGVNAIDIAEMQWAYG